MVTRLDLLGLAVLLAGAAYGVATRDKAGAVIAFAGLTILAYGYFGEEQANGVEAVHTKGG